MISQTSSQQTAEAFPAAARTALRGLERRQNTRQTWRPAHLAGALLAKLRQMDRLLMVHHLAPAPFTERRRQSRGRL